jgi:cytochrome c-type biogenesis protein CcmF
LENIQFIGENLLPGKIGQFFVVLSFCAAMLAAIAYFCSEKNTENQSESWLRLGKISFYTHALSVVGIAATLFYIIYTHLFEYHYAWSHSSKLLPTHYIISCFWEGQEGSFLLWTFWHAVIGIVLIRTAANWQKPVMAILSLVQVMLSSMLLGYFVLGYKVGSSPFILLREAMQAPIFSRPNYLSFIADGNGLNPLLQNYWMVIHPPVLFLGFAGTVVPFAYVCAALWRNDFTTFITPTLRWALFTAMILGVGIMMGGAWAYESLSFGGYWAWDPVENASLVPWLTLIAATHVLLTYKNTQNSGASAIILFISTFLLILYATFLTRSGILGNSSVHAFTDLGMSGQLLIFLFLFVIISATLTITRWKKIPKTPHEESTYSREFWMFIGALVLCLSAFQIIAYTSIPVVNKIFGTHLAPPTQPVATYNRWQIPLAIIIVVLTAIGQFFKYKKDTFQNLLKKTSLPLIAAAVLCVATTIALTLNNFIYIMLLFAAIFGVWGNAQVIFKTIKKIKKSGAAIAHVGFGLMLLGALISSGKQQIISINREGIKYGEDFNEKNTLENILLWKDEPKIMDSYMVTYLGDSVAAPDTYFKVLYQKLDANNKPTYSFVLTPNAQINPKMGLIANPDTRHYASHDIFTHVSQVPDKTANDQTPEYKEPISYKFSVKNNMGDTLFIGKNLLMLQGISNDIPTTFAPQTKGAEIAAVARILVKSTDNKITEMMPVYAIKQGTEYTYEAADEKLGLKIWFNKILPQENKIELLISERNPARRDYIIMKAIVFPYINILWAGVIIMAVGFIVALIDRLRPTKTTAIKP